jgi:hypothetical protein
VGWAHCYYDDACAYDLKHLWLPWYWLHGALGASEWAHWLASVGAELYLALIWMHGHASGQVHDTAQVRMCLLLQWIAVH